MNQMLHAVENCFKNNKKKLNYYTYSGKYPFIIFKTNFINSIVLSDET
jgi:hypothetical protein